MSKLKIMNYDEDSLLRAAGLSRVISDPALPSSKIERSKKTGISIYIQSSEMSESDSGIHETVKIKVTSSDGKGATIRKYLRNSGLIRNHTSSILKMVDLNSKDQDSILKGSKTFSIDCKFNYVSEDYDLFQEDISEHNLNSFLDECSKDEILNFKKRKTSRLSTYGRGDQMRNFVVPHAPQDRFSKTAPYLINISLYDQEESNLFKFLEKISIYDEVLNDYLHSDKEAISFNIQDGSYTNENVQIQGYQLDSFFNSTKQIDLDNFYGLNNGVKASKMSYDLRKHLFRGYLKAASKVGFRRFSDIIMNKECYKEALCYSLEKFDGQPTESSRLQNIYLPPNSSNINFDDTQVKYGKRYYYRCKSHYMIVGNSYSYEKVRFFEEDGVTYATAVVVNKPDIVVIPFDTFSESKTILMPPPAFPQVTFKTESNTNKEIQIYLSPTKSMITSMFTEITESDSEQHELLKEFYSTKDGYFTFHSKDSSGLFEIFRLSTPPKSYFDFSNAKLGEIRMPYMSTDAIFKDHVENGKEYYYTFRQVNQKGLFSNPTVIFKVRLVVDADDAKVIVETYHFPKPVVSEQRKDFKSLIQIKPSVEQSIFNENQSPLTGKTTLKGALNDLQLGSAKHSVWGRKFKLRIRSKTSGKIIDLNINFELSKNKTKEEM